MTRLASMGGLVLLTTAVVSLAADIDDVPDIPPPAVASLSSSTPPSTAAAATAPAESTQTDQTTGQVRDAIKDYLDSNDKLLVIEVTNADWATTRIGKEITDWMKKNL